jgi:hypothetical protein
MKTHRIVCSSLAAMLAMFAAMPLMAAESEWKTLFDGKSLAGWNNGNGRPPAKGWVLKDGAMIREEGGGDVWTNERYGDFVLELEYRTEGNSGIFIRTDKPGDCVQTGLEIQVDVPAKSPSKHSTGALYDAQAPTRIADKPRGEWNHVVITAKGSKINVELNGAKIIDADLDQWTKSHQNPDGSQNKFDKALKDFCREGYIGFQDHGNVVAYRNVRLKPL